MQRAGMLPAGLLILGFSSVLVGWIRLPPFRNFKEPEECRKWPHYAPETPLMSFVFDSRRYLVVPEWSGRTNNNILELRNAARVARSLKRTLIVPHQPFLDDIDLDSLANAGFSIKIDKSPRIALEYQLLISKLGILSNRWKNPMPGEFLQSCFEHPRVKRLYIPSLVMFYSCTDELDIANDFDSAFHPSRSLEPIIKDVQKQLNLTKYQYVAVHQRWLEGECLEKITDYFSTLPKTRAFAACNITADTVRTVLQQAGIKKGTPLYLADDRQNTIARKSLFEAGALSVQNLGIKALQEKEVMVDLFMLADSGFMIGNPVSTMSITAYHIRSVRFAKNPNLFQSIREENHFQEIFDKDSITQMGFPLKLGLEESVYLRKLHKCAYNIQGCPPIHIVGNTPRHRKCY